MSTTAKIAVIAAVFLLVPVVLIAAAVGAASSLLGGSSGAGPSQAALADIPADYLSLYLQAAQTCPGLDWAVLAAIGKVESDHGRSTLPGVHRGSNYAGAQGPMQFLPTTFVQYSQPIPPGGVTPATPYDPVDAIYAAARMLCANGAQDGRDVHAAVFSYNHSEDYVAQVLDIAQRYRSTTGGPAALVAVAFARAQLDKPYIWGGNGNPGFDCSGLTKAAYAAAGIILPRVAQDQYNAGPLLPAGQPLQPGDLVFFGTSTADVSHVGIAVSPTDMIDAPDVGLSVRVEPIWKSHLVGATRPAAAPGRQL
ncbi:bifunctional lytic transglycosylase/C40 family peptidase [Kutzneria sp. NPDC051319]|uniref:C40 family peptidase n=1 Tax=Kutzneria sp. NPDC051319 TaxID=3155047 RepID=UPI0034440465